MTANMLPDFLSDNPMPKGSPWGSATANNTNYYDTWPDTGVTRRYEWTVAKGACAPDGVEMPCVLVNNQFPGPLIEANWGDNIEITVTNNLEDEGVAIHLHGFLQKNTQWMDGVPGVSQCPIAPGKTFTYKTRAQLYGSAWYHSHYDAQSASGLYGPIVIYGPKNADYDHDLGPVLVADWVHSYYKDLVDELMAPYPNARIPPSDNVLINGLNPYYGADAPTAKFQVQSGKKYRLRLISAACSATQKITLDGHTFTVIANDFVPINPYETDHITLSVGQRSDVIVNFDKSPDSAVWLRTFIAPCSDTEGQTEGKAAIYYENADRNSLPVSSPGPNAYNTWCGNDDLQQTTPYYPIKPSDPEFEEVIPISAQVNGTHLLWYMAGRTFRTNYNDPMLLEAKLGNLNFPEIENVHNYGSNSSIRFVVENTGMMAHPMHLHGHNMFILAEGECTDNNFVFGRNDSVAQADLDHPAKQYGNCWDGHITNSDNPQRRDVQMLLPGRYIVVQWNQDNPGVWPFHCHLTWHAAAGFIWMNLERPEEIRDLPIPSTMADTCRDWARWTGENVVDMIDDGL